MPPAIESNTHSVQGEVMLQPSIVHPAAKFLAPSAAVAALLFSVAPLVRAQAAHVTIDGTVTIVESAQEPGPVHRATQDLVSDFTKVFGKAPRWWTVSTPLGRPRF
jgi:hypothetical protein